jgi:hypothetical protein
MESIREELGSELKGSWRLFEAGILREAYATASPTRVVFVLRTRGGRRECALAHLHKLRMVAAGLMHVELVELLPFVTGRCSLRTDRRTQRRPTKHREGGVHTASG